MMTEITIDPEVLLAQFNKLMQELLRGTMNRNCFRPWEIDLLLDIESCNLRESNRREILRRYQKAVQRHFDRGATTVLRLSEYLTRNRKRAQGLQIKELQTKGTLSKETNGSSFPKGPLPRAVPVESTALKNHDIRLSESAD